jgi:hypothetical protein
VAAPVAEELARGRDPAVLAAREGRKRPEIGVDAKLDGYQGAAPRGSREGGHGVGAAAAGAADEDGAGWTRGPGALHPAESKNGISRTSSASHPGVLGRDNAGRILVRPYADWKETDGAPDQA